MKDPKRVKRIARLFAEAWELVPEWRFCQLISNLHGTGPQDIFYTEDDDLEKSLNKFINDYKDTKKSLKDTATVQKAVKVARKKK